MAAAKAVHRGPDGPGLLAGLRHVAIVACGQKKDSEA